MMQRKQVRVTSDEKLIVHNVRHFFEKEKLKQQSIMRNEAIRRTAMATGIGMTMVKSVKRELMTAGDFSSPVKRYKDSRVRVFCDDFDREAIRLAVHDF